MVRPGRRTVEYVIDTLNRDLRIYKHRAASSYEILKLPLTRAKQIPKQLAYGENGRIVVSGSDHGAVYIYDADSHIS